MHGIRHHLLRSAEFGYLTIGFPLPHTPSGRLDKNRLPETQEAVLTAVIYQVVHLLSRDVPNLGLEALEALGGPLQALQCRNRPVGDRLFFEGGVAVCLDAVHPESSLHKTSAGLVLQEL